MGVVGRPRGISRLLEIAFAVLAGAILGIWTMSILTPADRTRVHFPIPTQVWKVCVFNDCGTVISWLAN